MAEPQPEGIQEGDQAPLAAPSSSEDRKAATALSNLDAKADNDTVVKQADPEALGRAMKDLKVGDTQVKEPPAKAVKVDAADVTFLVSRYGYVLSDMKLSLLRHSSWTCRRPGLLNC